MKIPPRRAIICNLFGNKAADVDYLYYFCSVKRVDGVPPNIFVRSFATKCYVFQPCYSKANTFVWRDGRVVDYNGLENRRTARYRGFESLSLRF